MAQSREQWNEFLDGRSAELAGPKAIPQDERSTIGPILMALGFIAALAGPVAGFLVGSGYSGDTARGWSLAISGVAIGCGLYVGGRMVSMVQEAVNHLAAIRRSLDDREG